MPELSVFIAHPFTKQIYCAPGLQDFANQFNIVTKSERQVHDRALQHSIPHDGLRIKDGAFCAA